MAEVLELDGERGHVAGQGRCRLSALSNDYRMSMEVSS